jgi:hypothetical protein
MLCTLPPSWPTVREAVIAAVKLATMIMEANIQTSATTRPPGVAGALSPWPTVVMVTAAHQKPSPTPRPGLASNWSVLPRRSNSQTAIPGASRTAASPPTTVRNCQVKKLRTTRSQPPPAFASTAMPSPV